MSIKKQLHGTFVLMFLLVGLFVISESLLADSKKQDSEIEKAPLKEIDFFIEKVEIEGFDGGIPFEGEDGRIFVYWRRTGPKPDVSHVKLKYWFDGEEQPARGLSQDSSSGVWQSAWIGFILPPGEHTIKYMIDSDNRVRESNEFNNVKIFKLKLIKKPTRSALKPDLKISNFDILQDGRRLNVYKKGKPVTLICAWERIGPVVETSWQSQFYYHIKPVGRPSTVTPSKRITKGTFKQVFTPDKPGRWKVGCKIDTTNVVQEMNEDNNQAEQYITVR